MPEPFYFVAIARSGQLAALGRSEVVVELVCADHHNVYEHERRSSAKEIALIAMRHRYSDAALDIEYISAKLFTGNLPAKFLKTADFSALCGCRAWYWS
jgi:hypothetical protein